MRAEQMPTDPDLNAVRTRRESLRSAMGAFEVGLAAPAAGRVPDWVAALVGPLGLLDQRVKEHVAATEGPAGFHREIVLAVPRLSHSVTVLVVEHHRMAELLDQLMRATSHARTDGQVGGIRGHGTTLLALLAKHRQRGSDLIYEAYQRDLGGGD